MYPKAIEVKPLDDYKLFIVFDNGEKRIYDAKPLIKGSWFGKLCDKKLFNTIHIAAASVEWADGQDVAPDELYYASVLV